MTSYTLSFSFQLQPTQQSVTMIVHPMMSLLDPAFVVENGNVRNGEVIETGLVHVAYDDGDQEVLNLSREKCERESGSNGI